MKGTLKIDKYQKTLQNVSGLKSHPSSFTSLITTTTISHDNIKIIPHFS